VAAPKAKAPPQETKTYYICPCSAAHGGFVWRGIGRKRHRERYPKCPYEPFGVSYQRAELAECVEATQRKADEQDMDEGKRSKEVKRTRKTFFAERARQANAEWRVGRGRAVALKRAVNGGHLVRIVVPPQCKPGDFFAHRGVKGHPIKRTADGRYVESKEEDVWEQEPDARSDAATPACPIGPVPDPRPDTMIITVWAREQRPSEAAKAAAKAAEAAEWAEQEKLAFGNDDDDDADDEPGDDDEEGEAEEGEVEEDEEGEVEEDEEGEVAPTAAVPAEPAEPAATLATPDAAVAMPAAPAAMPIAVAAPAAASVSAASAANARIEAAVAAALAEAMQGGMSAAVAQRKVRCSKAPNLQAPTRPLLTLDSNPSPGLWAGALCGCAARDL
jgi:hypothetical protein